MNMLIIAILSDEVDGCGTVPLKTSLPEKEKIETSLEDMEPDILHTAENRNPGLLSLSNDPTLSGDGHVMNIETTENDTPDEEVPEKMNQSIVNDGLTDLKESANAVHINEPVVDENIDVAKNSETTSVPMEIDSESKELAVDKDPLTNYQVSEDEGLVTKQTDTGNSITDNLTKGDNSDAKISEKNEEDVSDKMETDETLKDCYKSKNDEDSEPGLVITEVRSETWSVEVQNSEVQETELSDNATKSDNEMNEKPESLQNEMTTSSALAEHVIESHDVTDSEKIATLQQKETENNDLQREEEKTESQLSDVPVIPSSQTSSETESHEEKEPKASSISAENEIKKSETNVRTVEPKTTSIPSYFDSSEASESDQSPRLVIAMPDPGVDSESTESPIKGKEDNSLTTSIETAPEVVDKAAPEGVVNTVDKRVDLDMLNPQNQNSEIVTEKEANMSMADTENVTENNDVQNYGNRSVLASRDTDQHHNQVSNNPALEKVRVKQEPLDCFIDCQAEEGGDILDILNAQNTKNSVVVTDKSNTVVHSGLSTNKPRRKTEPTDRGYGTQQGICGNSGNFNQSCDSNRNILNVRSLQSSSSLSKLSQQVADLPQAVRPAKLPASQNRMQTPVSTHVPNNARFQVPHSVTRMPVVLQVDTHSNSKKAYTLVPLSQAGAHPNTQQRILKKTVINDTMNKGQPLISKISHPVVPTSSTIVKKVPITAPAGSSIVNNPLSVVKHNIEPKKINLPTQKIDMPAMLQNNVRLAQSELPVTSINIDTVGLGKITELIARKNPIPNYKPPPVPENLKKVLGTRPTYVCYECGDTYALADSLVQHRGRYSMKIVFKCDDCNAEKTFFNKCQFLSHLRGHLNIDKTKAVPIHIKSDSIVISTLPEEYQKMMFKQTNINANKSPALNLEVLSRKRCRECGLQVDNKKFLEHYGQDKIDCDIYRNTCSQCHMRIPSVCALRGHRRIHRFQTPFVCPECGTDRFHCSPHEPFMNMWNDADFFSYHLRDVCFHLSRSLIIPCPKCNQDMTSVDMLKNHLMQNLEQYFKCQDCPMAFKSQETFKKHYEQHTVSTADKNRRHFKVIYRCHICDSVMDDPGVLQIHTNHHVLDKAIYKFKCLFCSKYFKDKEELSVHFHSQHDELRGTKDCTLCPKHFNRISEVVKHHLTDHTIVTSSVDTYKSCGDCGLMVKGADMSRHSLYNCVARKGPYYECKFCHKRMTSKQAHVAHLKTHSSEITFACNESSKKDFRSRTELMKYGEGCSLSPNVGRSAGNLDDMRPSNTNFHTNVGVHHCATENCQQSFVTLEELNQHRKNDHGLNLLFPCHLCGLTYENQASLHRHIRLTHEAKRHVYPCWICRNRKIKRAFSSAAMLEKHVTTRHRIPKDQLDYSQFVREYDNSDENEIGGSNFQEDLKRKQSRFESDSPVKRLRVEGENVFNCAKCVYSSEDRTVFLNHILTHKIEKYVQCLECGLSFAVLPALRKHLFMVHKIKDFDSYCQEKGIEQIKEEVLNDQDLVLTVQSDESEDVIVEDEFQNPLECRVCHKMFESENKVRAHMRTHGMAFIRSKRQAAKSSNAVPNGNESSDSSHSSYSTLS
ncbi:hypothetical protein KUTeg_022601 [Tegillarca granosa]|uniref:C2H2-type domain-containing protein n=1 Tax=Tegillarca granosa TaxID=220873 RepID=A0ABQ9E316_TEGGR|nr:hypothetical protein KUTeg_022601 [Tegillarca granosa]